MSPTTNFITFLEIAHVVSRCAHVNDLESGNPDSDSDFSSAGKETEPGTRPDADADAEPEVAPEREPIFLQGDAMWSMILYSGAVALWIVGLLVFAFKYRSDHKHDREPFAAFLLLYIYAGVVIVFQVGTCRLCRLYVRHNKRLPGWLPALCIFFGLPFVAGCGLVAYLANEGCLLNYG